ncbi:hypothetical protein F5888DRAFT_1629402, partial [Russula emetica]
LLRAISNSSRIMCAPSPTYCQTSSEPMMRINIVSVQVGNSMRTKCEVSSLFLGVEQSTSNKREYVIQRRALHATYRRSATSACRSGSNVWAETVGLGWPGNSEIFALLRRVKARGNWHL